MLPEDRVLVGVINRKRDLKIALEQRWYRIPQDKMPQGVFAEYIAFFLSRAFKERNGAIHYFARRTGVELAYRRDLLPAEVNHPRSGEAYYKVQLDEVRSKQPPIRNTTRRSISFIYTTWDRFLAAKTIADLYSDADYFVDRLYHALRQNGVKSRRLWQAEKQDGGAQLRILCQNGVLKATTEPLDGALYLGEDEPDKVLERLRLEIARHGGAVMGNIPLEGY